MIICKAAVNSIIWLLLPERRNTNMKKGIRTGVKFLSAFIASLMCFQSIFSVGATELGVDISVYQGNINWEEFDSNNLGFVIFRTGTTKYGKDENFESYYENASRLDIKKGAYFYTSALSLEEFKKDAYSFIELLKGKEWEMPVFLDVEEYSQLYYGKDKLTTNVLAALNILSNAGYKAGLYTSKSWLLNGFDREKIYEAGYDVWMAVYPSTTNVVDPNSYDYRDYCDIWQFTSLGKYAGITQNTVDINLAYKSYPDKKYEKMVPLLWNFDYEKMVSMKCGPGSEFGEITKIPQNTLLKVTEVRDNGEYKWGKVVYNGFCGWACMDRDLVGSGANQISDEDSIIKNYYFDLNDDGSIDGKDESLVHSFVLRQNDKSDGAYGDVTRNGRVDVLDCIRYKKEIIDK